MPGSSQRPVAPERACYRQQRALHLSRQLRRHIHSAHVSQSCLSVSEPASQTRSCSMAVNPVYRHLVSQSCRELRCRPPQGARQSVLLVCRSASQPEGDPRTRRCSITLTPGAGGVVRCMAGRAARHAPQLSQILLEQQNCTSPCGCLQRAKTCPILPRVVSSGP